MDFGKGNSKRVSSRKRCRQRRRSDSEKQIPNVNVEMMMRQTKRKKNRKKETQRKWSRDRSSQCFLRFTLPIFQPHFSFSKSKIEVSNENEIANKKHAHVWIGNSRGRRLPCLSLCCVMQREMGEWRRRTRRRGGHGGGGSRTK